VSKVFFIYNSRFRSAGTPFPGQQYG